MIVRFFNNQIQRLMPSLSFIALAVAVLVGLGSSQPVLAADTPFTGLTIESSMVVGNSVVVTYTLPAESIKENNRIYLTVDIEVVDQSSNPNDLPSLQPVKHQLKSPALEPGQNKMISIPLPTDEQILTDPTTGIHVWQEQSLRTDEQNLNFDELHQSLPVTRFTTLKEFLDVLMPSVLTVRVGFFLIGIIIAGIMIIMASGDPEKAKAGFRYLKALLIAALILILAVYLARTLQLLLLQIIDPPARSFL